jgi:hypothetical protein
MITQIENGMIANAAVNVNNLSANPANANSKTLLSGVFDWIYQDSHYFDMGTIYLSAGNMIQLLLQSAPVDFNQRGLAYDAGSIE